MAAARRILSTSARPLNAALVVISVFAALLGLFQLRLFDLQGPAGVLLALLPLVFWVYVAAGVLAWWLRPANGTGFLIIVAGAMIFISGLGNTAVPSLVAVSVIGGSLALPAVAHLLLAFPAGRLPDRLSRGIVVALYAATVLFGIPSYLFDPAGPFPPLAVADLPALVAISSWLRILVGTTLLVAVAVVLLHRLRTSEVRHRRVLWWLYSYGIFAVVVLPLLALVLERVLGVEPMLRGYLQYIVIAGIPVFFALGVVRGGFARTAELEELVTWLGETNGASDDLRLALAGSMGDPTLQLYFADEGSGALIDADGGLADPAHARRRREPITLDGRQIGAIDYDAALIGDAQLASSAARVVAIAVERERLTAELWSSQHAVLESRERLLEAADQERRRIARDLHDGLQVQLVLLALEAQQLAVTPSPLVRERATQLRRDIDDAASELRTFVHELVPAALIERGLAAAARDLADRMPMKTEIDVRIDRRLSQAVETAAYFGLAESLSNAVKHSSASKIHVSVATEGDMLRLTVGDDGVGVGRAALASEGTGLHGMRDRVETLGGALHVDSEEDGGTIVTMEMPCGL